MGAALTASLGFNWNERIYSMTFASSLGNDQIVVEKKFLPILILKCKRDQQLKTLIASECHRMSKYTTSSQYDESLFHMTFRGEYRFSGLSNAIQDRKRTFSGSYSLPR